MNWQTTPPGRERCFHFYSEDQPPNGTKITLPTLVPARMSEQISSIDFQKDETNSGIKWKWNFVLEEMEKNFGTFCTVSKERLN